MVSRKWLFAGLQAAAEVTSIDGERRKVEVVGGAMKTASRERTQPGRCTPEIDQVSNRKFELCQKKKRHHHKKKISSSRK